MSKKILVVDDSRIARSAARASLEPAGFTVVELADSAGLVGALTRERPDLVLMDVEMPGKSGDEAAAAAAKVALHKCPFVLYSSKPAVELTRLARACGAVGFIEKSASPSTVLAKVRLYAR